MPRKALCGICLELKEKTTHFALYVSGSEGVNLCHDCEMLVIKFIQESARAVFKKHRIAHLNLKEKAIIQEEEDHA